MNEPHEAGNEGEGARAEVLIGVARRDPEIMAGVRESIAKQLTPGDRRLNAIVDVVMIQELLDLPGDAAAREAAEQLEVLLRRDWSAPRG